MCGLNGIFSYNVITDDVVDKIKKMNNDMLYRGPDGNGFYNNEKIALGHVRLSIVGLENGAQPLFNEDKSLVIVFNGEIYNYLELKDKLIKKGYKFKTASDTEVILNLFDYKKEKMLDDLIGMFTIAIYDIKNKKLFIARDICGEKPLYYANTPKGFVFSSEISGIAKYFLKEPNIDNHEINNFLLHSFSQTLDKTFIKQIKRIEPATYCWIDDNDIIFKKYWKKTNTYSYKNNYEEAKKDCLSLIRESVKMTIPSEVPVAVLLSSGIDSSTVATILKENMEEVHTLTLGFKGCPKGDEREIAKKLAKEKGFTHHEIEIDDKLYLKYFDELIQYLDEPLTEISIVNKYAVFKECKRLGFKVVLSGTGGDEIFYGYPNRNFDAERLTFFDKMQKIKNKKNFFKWLLLYFNSKNIFNVKDTDNHFQHHLPRLLGYGRGFKNLEYQLPIEFDFKEENYRERYYNDEKENIDKVYSYLFNIFLNHCFHFDDKMSMANSIEFRNPLCNKKLIDFVSSLPLEYKYDKNSPKKFLKDTLKDILPDYILNGSKKGLNPLGNILETAMIKKYNRPKILNCDKLKTYESVLIDEFLAQKKNSFLQNSKIMTK